MVQLDYRDARPIYTQIVDNFKSQIAAGILQSGERLPSVRELAGTLAINPNTIQRAYRELEAQGVIQTVPGKGCFVKGQNTDFLREEIVRQAEDLLKKACEKAKMAELTSDDLKEIIDMLYGGEI